jgi:hypothetical protein
MKRLCPSFFTPTGPWRYLQGLFYSPSPEYPAACRSGAKISPSGAAGMKGKVNRAEAHQSEGGLISLCHFMLEWLRRNSALIPRSLLRGASFYPLPYFKFTLNFDKKEPFFWTKFVNFLWFPIPGRDFNIYTNQLKF